jgi:hypothetical protein
LVRTETSSVAMTSAYSRGSFEIAVASAACTRNFSFGAEVRPPTSVRGSEVRNQTECARRPALLSKDESPWVSESGRLTAGGVHARRLERQYANCQWSHPPQPATVPKWNWPQFADPCGDGFRGRRPAQGRASRPRVGRAQ